MSEEDMNKNNSDDDSDSEYEEYDLTDNPLYQVLSAFFETEDGKNVCDVINKLTDAVNNNTKQLSEIHKMNDKQKKKKKVSSE
jgi:hypothetical protein